VIASGKEEPWPAALTDRRLGLAGRAPQAGSVTIIMMMLTGTRQARPRRPLEGRPGPPRRHGLAGGRRV
jgi:hypothetical protein